MNQEQGIVLFLVLFFLIDCILFFYLLRRRTSMDTANLSKEIKNVNKDLLNQMNIVLGLSNAYFSVYSVDLETGRCNAVKVIDFFRSIVKNCHSTVIVTRAFLGTCVMPEDRGKMKEFTDWKTLADRLSDSDLIVEEFHGMIDPWEWCRASWIVASRDKNRKVKHVLFTVEDITESVQERLKYEQEREQGERELETSRLAAEAANRAKTDFLFNMSHDIRTPMNAIIGYASLMEKYSDQPAKCKDYLDKIKKSSGFLLSLVNNVLEMARIESGKIVLEEEVCKAEDLLDQVNCVYSKLMEQKGIKFITDIEVRSEYYYGDKVKLSEIFLNIISNAYKYTETGGKISLHVKELEFEQEGYIRLQTIISDTGIGMSEEYLPKIFEEFSREHTSTENKIEGTGLGMPIVKKLVDLMDGEIEVQSKLSEGTTFTVTIPHKIAEAQDVKMETPLFVNPKKFKGKRILLVEDNELNMEIATELLQEFGFVIEHAEDGLICIDKLAKAQNNYDLILMDVQMPNLDGYEATKKIRHMKDKTKANIPIIAMTANAFEEDRKNALAVGMNGHLAKPIEMPKLMEMLTKIFE